MAKGFLALLTAIAVPLVFAGTAFAYHGQPGGHLPPVQKNVDLVSKLRLTGAAPDRFADVAVLGNYAYVGRWALPSCPGGVTVVDISNPAAPHEVASITAPPGTYQTEGVHAIHLDTPAFRGDILVVSNERCSPDRPGAAGGISIYDVTNPASPQPLVIGFGDTEGSAPLAHQAHSAFAWDAGDRAFVSIVDNAEIGQMGIDIAEITDPRNPRLIAESGVAVWPGAQDAQSTGIGVDRRPYHHDSIVRRIGGNWIMLVNYWDAGHVLLNVNDPANPVFIEDSTYPNPDPLIALEPEGNAHQGEWGECPESNALPIAGGCTSPRWVLGTDEDFSAFRLRVRLTSGTFSGDELPMTNASDTPPITETRTMAGPTYFVGLACTPLPPAPSANAIAVAERGVCTFQAKLDSIVAAGYQGGIVFNSAAPGNCETFVIMLASGPIPFVFVNRSGGYRVLNVPGYNPANCPAGANPSVPAVGTRGSDVDTRAFFDAWTGGVRLFDAATLREADSYVIPEALDRRFAEDFGILSVHEVATDPAYPVGYVSWYSAGAVVLDWRTGELRRTGQYIDEGGMDVWGTQLFLQRSGSLKRYFVQSDRNFGLFIFRYGTDLQPRKVPGRSVVRVGQTLSYRLRIANSGTITETHTVVRDRLPRRARFVSAFASQGRCGYRHASRTVTCNLGSLRDDAGSAFVQITVRATRAGTVRNTAVVSGAEVDYDTGNNAARAVTRVRRASARPSLTGRTG